MNKIILGEQQQEALNLIIDFIHSNKRVFSLVGYAGTGKSTMMKQIIDYLENNKSLHPLYRSAGEPKPSKGNSSGIFLSF